MMTKAKAIAMFRNATTRVDSAPWQVLQTQQCESPYVILRLKLC
jgi:hypothetical protein